MSTFLAITSAVRDALLATPALADGRIRRGRDVPVAAAESSGITVNVRAASGESFDLLGQSIRWETVVDIDVYARATASQDAEAALDPLLVSVWDRLYSLAPPAGCTGIALEPGVDWDVDEADTTVCAARVRLRVTHITTGAALSAA